MGWSKRDVKDKQQQWSGSQGLVSSGDSEKMEALVIDWLWINHRRKQGEFRIARLTLLIGV